VKVTLWGTRGSLAAPGAETTRYGGNTSCVEVRGDDGTILVLDAGTGIRPLARSLPESIERIDVLLTHLHMDHVQGLGFFDPLFDEGVTVHLWGPASLTNSLRTRLMRYLSPPLFPVRLRDLACNLALHEVPCGESRIGELRVSADLVCHPGATVAYRVEGRSGAVAYFPDHEPALGAREFPLSADWTSGYRIASGVDLLIHDSQYTPEEYAERVGWGHSSLRDAMRFAELAGVRHFVPFHHDPAHSDDEIDELIAAEVDASRPSFRVTPGKEGTTFDV
jgi:phosphoribosyl 1,2-cyclic phosphodiesterase